MIVHSIRRRGARLAPICCAGLAALTVADHDRFVRTEQGWRLASRSYVNLFTRGDTTGIP